MLREDERISRRYLIHDLRVTTPKMEQHLSEFSGKRWKKLLFKLEKKESKKTWTFSRLAKIELSVQPEEEEL